MAQTKIKLIADGVIDVNNLAAGHTITTDNIGEGSNLYYTDARVSNYLTTNSYATESFVTSGYLPLSGGTLTGNLIVNTNVGIGISTPTLVTGTIAHIHGTAAGVHLTDTVSGTTSSDGAYFVFDNPNLYIQNKEAGPTIFETSGSERMRIDSTGNIGIGESAPLGNLHIKSQDTGVTSVSAQGSNLIIEGTENGMSILSSTVGAGYINFGDSDDNDVGMIIYGHSSNAMSFWTNAGRRMTIDSSGRVGIGTSSINKNLQVATSAGQFGVEPHSDGAKIIAVNSTNTAVADLGIQGVNISFIQNGTEKARITSNGLTFNGDTAAANALDDYEEGTWTPSVYAGGVGTAVQSALYTKIGRQVTVHAYITITTTGTAAALVFSGLPFVATGIDDIYPVGALDASRCNVVGAVTRIDQNTNRVAFYVSSGSTSLDRIQLKGNNFGNSSYVIFTVTYIAA